MRVRVRVRARVRVRVRVRVSHVLDVEVSRIKTIRKNCKAAVMTKMVIHPPAAR